MTKVIHVSAEASHYDKESASYDAFNEDKSRLINETLEKILNAHQAKTILDLSCGTGSQVFWLDKAGYNVTGYDINDKMLDIARKKASEIGLNIRFEQGDMRTSQVGKFDAVLTIFNAIGHLTKNDFEQTIKNIAQNLIEGGLYIFDIFNLDYLLKGDNITKLTIDWQKKFDGITAREIQYSTIDNEGILASHDIYHEQRDNEDPIISTAYQTLQVYSAKQLILILEKYGFKVLKQCNIDGTEFIAESSERILTIAKLEKACSN